MAPPRTCDCGECQKCKHREYMNAYYRKNPEKIRQIARKSQEKNIEKIRARDRARGCRIYDLDKTKARAMLSRAVRSGKVIKQPCEVCGADKRIHGHHDDYNKPLEVKWLCPRHHGELHRVI